MSPRCSPIWHCRRRCRTGPPAARSAWEILGQVTRPCADNSRPRNRQLAPRPLPAHLASATMLWLTSRAALPVLKNASPPSNAVGDRLRALAAEIEALGIEPVLRALDLEIARQAEAYLAGLEAYRRHPFRRCGASPPVVWCRGTTQLLDYGCNGTGPTVLVIPSLIHRSYLLGVRAA